MLPARNGVSGMQLLILPGGIAALSHGQNRNPDNSTFA
jgi:hypothetical protein